MNFDQQFREIDSILTSAGIIAPARKSRSSKRQASSSARRPYVRPENLILASDFERALGQQIQAADDSLTRLTRQAASRFHQAMADAGFRRSPSGQWWQSEEFTLRPDRSLTTPCAGNWPSLAATAELDWQRVLDAAGHHCEDNAQPPAIVMPICPSPLLIYLLTCVAHAWDRAGVTLLIVRCRMHDASPGLQDYLFGRTRRAEQQHRHVLGLVQIALNVMEG